MTPIEIFHASFSFIAILGLLACIWFVNKSRAIALLVVFLASLGFVSALLGIYLALTYHHPKLVLAGSVSLFFYILVARYGLKNALVRVTKQDEG